ALDAAVLAAFNDFAEDLLGLSGAETDDAATIARALRAVAWQVNFMVGLHENEGTFQKDITLGPLRRTFRDVQVDPLAKRLADQVLDELGLSDGDAEGWEVTTSLR